MQYHKIVGFIVILAFHDRGSADKTVESNNSSVYLGPRNVSLNITDNATTIISSSKRKSVLILNSDPALRSVNKNKVSSLYYEEYDDNGKVLNTMWMYNLKDVAEFFRIFLDTEICYGYCKN
ncbi:uncharacterized protein LOC120625928 [Pararge aegeria]|uniref:uncharacterized protein LOC120625928 n=1 Tax=Pararge aegeria TaxID=116150 RepID=UPI0019D05072|nr:uncharacterized protein LOC120625928 [Pararge aegeria]